MARALFEDEFVVSLYVVSALPLAWHLHHGLDSGFKTLGLYDRQGLRLVARTARIYAIVMGVGFGLIPLVMYSK